MDKNKGRTDLLAAGRKKFQQYRQKKDSKGSGSHLKSSKKSGKSEQHDGDGDADVPSAAAEPMESLQIQERELGPEILDSNVGHVDLSLLRPFDDSVAPDSVLPTVNPLSVPGQLEALGGEMGDACNSRFPIEGSDIEEARSNSSVGNDDSYSLVLNEQKSHTTIEPDMVRVTALGTCEVAVSEGESMYATGTLPVDFSAARSEQDISDALLIQAREDQEADCSGSKQLDRISGVELQGDETPAVSEFSEGAEILSGVVAGASIMESTCDVEQPCASTIVGNESEDLSVTMAMPTDGVSDVGPEMADQWRENLVVSSSNEKESGVYYGCDDSRSYMGVAIQARTKRADYEGYIPDNFPDGFYESKGERCSKTLGTKMVITSGGSSATSREDVSTISLLQLAEVLNGLDEDEFRFLLKSKDSAPNASLGDTGSFLVPEYDFSDVLETYKEQLYLTNITKDIFALELMEHSKLQKVFDHQRQQLDDKISMLSALLNEASDTNKCLAEELAQSRSELQAVTSGREELKHEFQTATAEIVEFSARVLVLENELERSRRDFSGLSLELTDCKSVVDALRVENSNLSGSLTLAMEERRNLEEEVAKCKGLVADVQVANGELSGSLAFVTDERKKLGDTKAYFVCENEKLLSQLADCKSLVEAVEVEKASVCGTLALMTEEMKKLEEGKHHFVCENDRLRSELAECQSLVKTIQVENANLTEGLSLVTDERRKLEEEKENLSGENKGLSSELRVHQELLSVSQAENLQLNTDLREMYLWFEQLLEENIFLNSSLDVHKAKIREINHMQIQFAFHSRESSNRIESPDLPRSHINITNDKDFPQISGKQDGEIFSSLLEGKPLSDGYAGTAPKQLEQNVYSGASGIPDFNGHLEEADKVIQKLEMAIEEMHSHSASLSRSGGKVAASGVSKLIQAFESKTHLEDGEVEENLMTGDRSIADPFMLSKLQTVNLRTVLKELQLDVVKASEIFKGERNGREVANIAYTELKVQYEAIREYTENLEAMNIELEVQCEAVKQHVCNDEEKKRELVVLYESLQQENINLKAENTELGKKLNDFFVRINELHSQLGELQQSSEEISSSICNQIENLRNEAADKLEAARTDHEAICNSYKEVNEKLNDLREKKELAFGILNKIYGRLRKLTIDSSVYVEESELNIQNDEFLDPLDTRKYEDLMEQLGTFLGERPHLQCENNKLNTELVSRTNEMVELNRRCLDLNVVLKLVEDVEAFVKSEDLKIDFDNPPISRLDSFVRFLLQRYIEADERVNLAREELGLKVIEFSEQQKKINQLDSLNLTQKNEIVNLKESLSKAEEAIVAVRSELQEKTVEVEQSEQRVSSVREKLSIAVAKGKGLIVQRDNLKQSLQETSLELERSSHELQLKDARLHELEEKLKMYSEAGERVEALESELSYIRNSATALRESFLLKDSVLQRIEEILEDLELPESFHTRDIIEKVDWLARSVTGNSLPPNDWDQKSSVEGGSYSDAGFVVMDGWKEDMQPNSNPGDDLRRNYEELQGKIYELAEQNEMLEQSLMERNNLVQRWEEVLERINMPTRLRSMETEVRIEWLGSELSEAHQYAKALQQKIDNLENHCGTLAADLEESQRRLSDVEAAFQVVTHDKESLSKSLETLTFDHEKLSEQAVQFEHANDKLQNELTDLQEKMDEKHYQEEQVDRIEGEIIRLQDLVSDALQDPATKDLVSGGSSIECLEGLLRKLVDNYTSLCLEKSMHRAAVDAPVTEKVDATLDDVRNREIFDAEKPDVLFLKKELEEDLRNLTRLKEEGDIYREKHQSLACEVEALNKKMEELQELLSQEEKKSASARDKLNVAVRKGKSLVQQRDSLKQAIEERNNEVESLKSVISQQENYIAQYEQKIKDLSTYPERVASLESENFSLSNHLIETEHRLQEKGHTLVLILNTLGEIDVGGEYSHSDPIVKLEQLGKLCSELHTGVASSEQESRKCKRAAELLLEELNEVQERNDSLQEELAKAGSELLALSKERDMAQAAKLEAFSRLENLSSAHSEVKKIEHADFMALKSVVHQLRGSFFDVNNLLADVLLKDLEILHNLEANMELCLKSSGATNAVGLPLVNTHGGVSSYLEFKEKFLARDFGSDIKRQEYYDDRDGVEVCRDVGHDLQGFSTEMSALKEKIQKHSFSLDEKAGKLSTVLETIRGELTSQAESFEALNKYIVSFESLEKEKDTENVILRKNIFLLYEACANSIMEIENRKASLFGNSFPAGGVGMELKSAAAANGEQLFGGRVLLSSEEQIRTMADGLLMLVKELASMEAEIIEGRQKEMKTTIANLQKELQEKDIQKDKICMELVSQIREAEAAATSYSVHFQSAKTQVHDLQKRMEVVEEERISLERRVKELQDREATSIELQEKVRSMTEMVAAKDQEIESLMQALDEEEMQMEELANKISELEKVGHQKNIDLENLEASRGKAMKKLSITVNKFDELHNLSASLLSEVEKLQSQLQDRDSEISFLRQEVTRSTNDVLIASQMSNKNNSDEIHAFLIWLDTMFSRVQVHDVYLDDLKGSQIHELKEILQKQITSIISELEDLRIMAQTKDTLIQIERSRVEELTRKGDIMENSLRQKETQLNILNSARDSVEKTSTTPEIVEVEPEINKWTVPGTSIASKLRSLRKVNNDQVAIDMDPTSSIRLEDEDDDKVHGFKSLTTSRIVPRFTRPVTDMIDGLWVSCDRALMRQPALRLGIIIYWAVLHALFATFAV